jgi:hypothetical protein
MIRISRVGTTRLVLVVGPWAFKFARGPRGRRCNKYEADLFKTVDDRRRAIAWSSSGGGPLVMASAQPLTASDHENLLDSDGFPDWDYMPGEDGDPFEPKASDWGRINGRLVALDYSTPVYDTAEDLAEMRRAASGE